MIHAFGDSFVVGDQDDFMHDAPRGTTFSHNFTNYDEHLQYLKYQVSFVSIIAKELDLPLINYASRGSGNYPQLDKLFQNLVNGNIKSTDIVMFGLTTSSRDRSSLLEFKRAQSNSYGECMVDRELLNTGDFQTIGEMDHFYILSTLEMLSNKFNVKIIKFNLFDNPLDRSNINVLKNYQFSNFIGAGVSGNTLIDILNDSWGQGIQHPYHDRLLVPSGYENLYTVKKHPSIIGHKKIAEWFLKNVNIK